MARECKGLGGCGHCVLFSAAHAWLRTHGIVDTLWFVAIISLVPYPWPDPTPARVSCREFHDSSRTSRTSRSSSIDEGSHATPTSTGRPRKGSVSGLPPVPLAVGGPGQVSSPVLARV